MPWADSRIICDRRHVTTDPDERRTVRNNRWPSSWVISRTLTFSATSTSWDEHLVSGTVRDPPRGSSYLTGRKLPGAALEGGAPDAATVRRGVGVPGRADGEVIDRRVREAGPEAAPAGGGAPPGLSREHALVG